MKYRGREIVVEIIGSYSTGGVPKRIKRYTAEVNMEHLTAMSEEEICDKIDEILGPPPESPKD
ncbi:MAG: hypothetical protein WD063_13125 [Pirellulales bacterium]